MNRYRPWRGAPQETPLTFIILLAYAVLMYPGRRGGDDASLADRAREAFAATGYHIQAGEPWRLLTHAFVHGGLVHVLFNGFALLAFGPTVERWLGSARFGLLYAVSAVAGGVAAVYWQGPVAGLVGGSGALFGMMGAVLALNMRAGRHLLDFLDYAGPRSFIGLIVANLIIGAILPFVSNAAHVGGLVAGFVLTFCFLERGDAISDGLSRAARAGWVMLLCSSVAYTCWPTARIDHLWQRARTATDPEEQRELLTAIELLPREEVEAFLANLRPVRTDEQRPR